MGKDKRKGKKRGSTFDYAFGTGQIGKLMDRYDIEGTRSSHPDGRTRYSSGGDVNDGSPRTREDVDKDIAKAMMNDYDTRRSMEAAAMAGDKEAKKFAKKGFKAGNIYSAADTMRELKKKYVGGGGMNGAKNRAGLTQAIVQADRDAFIADNDAKYASRSDLDALQQEQAKATAPPVEDSKELSDAKERVKNWEQFNSGSAGNPTPYGDADPDPSPYGSPVGAIYEQAAEAEATPGTTSQVSNADSYLEAFKAGLKQKKNFQPEL